MNLVTAFSVKSRKCIVITDKQRIVSFTMGVVLINSLWETTQFEEGMGVYIFPANGLPL